MTGTRINVGVELSQSSCYVLTSDDAVLVFRLCPADFERRVQDFGEAQVTDGSRC